MVKTRLVFVYNADSGFFNALTDIAHKAFSPATYRCSLCAITHDLLKEKAEWRDFIESLDAEMEFLHKDELITRYGPLDKTFPAIYRDEAGTLRRVVSAQQLGTLNDIEELKQLILDISSQT